MKILILTILIISIMAMAWCLVRQGPKHIAASIMQADKVMLQFAKENPGEK